MIVTLIQNSFFRIWDSELPDRGESGTPLLHRFSRRRRARAFRVRVDRRARANASWAARA